MTSTQERNDVTQASSALATLRVEHLSVNTSSLSLLRSVNLTAQQKELTAVIGPNGAGKTTLLEAIVGLRHASSGQVTINGLRLQGFRQRAAQFAYLPDHSELPPELSVRTLVEHAERSRSGIANSPKIAELLAIAQLLHKPVGVLSQGERKRLQIFCTLLLGRPFAVLDEPFSSFDPLQLRDVLAAIRATLDSGVGVIASIHQLTDAERIADKLLLLAAGRAVAFGSLSELRETAGDAGASLEQVFMTLLSRSSHAA
ncbi:MAG TPA: ABC transporter ATP-binding protein [Polyangiaceae bacterium]|nr:ABC transporter ATP-binding protein [Polyangiaceae bacterium]